MIGSVGQVYKGVRELVKILRTKPEMRMLAAWVADWPLLVTCRVKL